jgi:hypothetical protein
VTQIGCQSGSFSKALQRNPKSSARFDVGQLKPNSLWSLETEENLLWRFGEHQKPCEYMLSFGHQKVTLKIQNFIKTGTRRSRLNAPPAHCYTQASKIHITCVWKLIVLRAGRPSGRVRLLRSCPPLQSFDQPDEAIASGMEF